jgi:hypothetical protein
MIGILVIGDPSLAHSFAARVWVVSFLIIPVHLLSDIAQIWPTVQNSRIESLVSVAGILARAPNCHCLFDMECAVQPFY